MKEMKKIRIGQNILIYHIYRAMYTDIRSLHLDHHLLKSQIQIFIIAFGLGHRLDIDPKICIFDDSGGNSSTWTDREGRTFQLHSEMAVDTQEFYPQYGLAVRRQCQRLSHRATKKLHSLTGCINAGTSDLN